MKCQRCDGLGSLTLHSVPCSRCGGSGDDPCPSDNYATARPTAAEQPAKGEGDSDLPGMWERSDFSGGRVDVMDKQSEFGAKATPQPSDPADADAQADNEAVDLFATAMKAKLADARAKGRGGWNTDECTQEDLSIMLLRHVGKGDPRDVANFACFLWNRGERITTPPTAQRHDTEGKVRVTQQTDGKVLIHAGDMEWDSRLHEPEDLESMLALTTSAHGADCQSAKADGGAVAPVAVEAVDAFGRTGPLLKGWDRLAREEDRPGHSRLTWAQAAADLRQVQMRNAALSTQPLLSDQAGGVIALPAKWRESAAKLDNGFGPGDALVAVGKRVCADELEAALHPEHAEDGDVS